MINVAALRKLKAEPHGWPLTAYSLDRAISAFTIKFQRSPRWILVPPQLHPTADRIVHNGTTNLVQVSQGKEPFFTIVDVVVVPSLHVNQMRWYVADVADAMAFAEWGEEQS